MRRGGRPGGRGLARAIALVALPIAVAATPATTSGSTAVAPGPGSKPNIVLILTDDQTMDALPHSPGIMPFLESQIDDPSQPWVRLQNAFLATPLCCPSRSSILSGRYPHHTRVETNNLANRFDDAHTVATWLHGAGYWTGYFGKYFNLYPFGRPAFVPPGWDRWMAKEGGEAQQNYSGYSVAQCLSGPSCVGVSPTESKPAGYSTDVYGDAALAFLQQAPAGKPFFMMFSPSAPHLPSTPDAGDAGTYASMPLVQTPDFNEADVSDKPAWIRKLPVLGPRPQDRIAKQRRMGFESLLDVDRYVHSMFDALTARGALENTIVVVMTDNGFSFGEHRWKGKACEYEECIRTPLYIRYPGVASRTDSRLVENVDLAPTFASLAGAAPDLAQDGTSLVPLLLRQPTTWRDALLLEWRGVNATTYPCPGFWGIRTAEYAYFELATGERELYDLAGANGPADPFELENRAGTEAYSSVQQQLAARLAQLRAG
jgi:arylsulfatase A-like enzyme